MTVAPEQDKTPDSVFIGLRPRRLRALIQRCGLTRAETAELIMIGLRINERNRCFPSHERSAEDAGRKSKHQVKRLHKSLKEKGALDWEVDPQGGSNTYVLPDAFFYGMDSYRESKSDSGGGSKTILSENRKVPQGGDLNRSPKQIHDKNNHIEEDPRKQQQQPGMVLPPVDVPSDTEDRHTRIEAVAALIKAGVFEREAHILVSQYRISTIYEVLSKANERSSEIKRPGAWIRKTIELKAAEKVKYPNSTSMEQQNKDRYLADDYFRRKEQQEQQDELPWDAADQAAK